LLKIKNSSRFTIGSFWDDREESDYPEETRKEWAEELAKIRAIQKEENEVWKGIRESGLRLSKQGEKYSVKEVLKTYE